MEKESNRKVRFGQVASNKMNKTVVVKVDRTFAHPQFGKVITRNKKYYAHSEIELEVGQKVKIEETRPISKLKRWRVVETV
ncbi:MAG: 30S ribosomal protein S17 [Rhabdochlamydiaceae bacterium]|nr:30S ribosomal protein S17 [Candidatus Amphrikana amoebophyrae]